MFNIKFRFKKGDRVIFKLSKNSPEVEGKVLTDKLDNGILWVEYKGTSFSIHKSLVVRPTYLQ